MKRITLINSKSVVDRNKIFLEEFSRIEDTVKTLTKKMRYINDGGVLDVTDLKQECYIRLLISIESYNQDKVSFKEIDSYQLFKITKTALNNLKSKLSAIKRGGYNEWGQSVRIYLDETSEEELSACGVSFDDLQGDFLSYLEKIKEEDLNFSKLEFHVLILYYIHGMTQVEISDELHTFGLVASQQKVSRILKRLGEEFINNIKQDLKDLIEAKKGE